MEKFGNWVTRNLSGEKMLLYTLWKDLRSYFEINKQSNKHLRSLQAEHIHRTHFLMKDKKWDKERIFVNVFDHGVEWYLVFCLRVPIFVFSFMYMANNKSLNEQLGNKVKRLLFYRWWSITYFYRCEMCSLLVPNIYPDSKSLHGVCDSLQAS